MKKKEKGTSAIVYHVQVNKKDYRLNHHGQRQDGKRRKLYYFLC